ncbi:hypothetical protein VK72_17950 [Paenibacillus polymyxa]|nr:hypothetical protein VK72_17950 [Paenibacillus polymyxa]
MECRYQKLYSNKCAVIWYIIPIVKGLFQIRGDSRWESSKSMESMFLITLMIMRLLLAEIAIYYI